MRQTLHSDIGLTNFCVSKKLLNLALKLAYQFLSKKKLESDFVVVEFYSNCGFVLHH